MQNQDDLEYHNARSLRELQLGLTAPSMAVARSHLQLSSLHMKRVLEMRGTDPTPRPHCILD